MGAKIGKNVKINTPYNIAFDLITIEDNVYIAHDSSV
jgi:hypothetical protein